MQRRPLCAAAVGSGVAGRFAALSSAVSSTFAASGAKAEASSDASFDPKRTLVVFYSRRGENYAPGGTQMLEVGHTERLARRIAEAFGTRIFEVRTVKPYPADYRETTVVAERELEEGKHPENVGPLPDLTDVDLVVLGHPIWWSRMPAALDTFLAQVDLSGKTVAHFCTHAGSGFGSSHRDLRHAEPDARIIDGPAVVGVDSAARTDEVLNWASGFIRR